MTGYSTPTREDDPVHTIRTIGRLAQIIIELRDEYVERPRPETLAQIEQRLDDIAAQREVLRLRLAQLEAEAELEANPLVSSEE